MRAQKTDTEVRQEQIAEAALELIGAEGVNALSVASIAGRVGIVPSGIYRHFKGKDEILETVLALLRKRLLGNVAAARAECPGALGRLKALLARHARMLAENRAIPHVVFSDSMYTGHPDRKRKVGGIIKGYLAEVEKIIREGQDEGSVAEDIAPGAAAVAFLGLILPAAVMWSVSGGKFDVAAHAERAWPVFERGIAAGVRGRQR